MSANDSIDWDLGKAPKQSITEVLQDPRGPILELPDISSIDLSAPSLTLTPVTPTNLPPPLNINHFESYLRRYAPLHSAYRHDIHPSLPSPSKEKTNIPSELFDESFDISSYIRIPDSSSMSSRNSAENLTLLSANPQLQSLRQKLVEYKSDLEIDLTATLDKQSTSINESLISLRALRTNIQTTAESLRETRKLGTKFPSLFINPIEKIHKLSQTRENIRSLRTATALATDASEAPRDIKDLLTAGAYSTAIHRIHDAREALLQLGNVHALVGVRKELTYSVEIVDSALRKEFGIALMNEDKNGMIAVIKLVERMGRGGVAVIRRVFIKATIDGLKNQLSVVDRLPAATKIVKNAASRAVLLIQTVHDDTNNNNVDEMNGTIKLEIGKIGNGTKGRSPSDSISDLSADDDLKQLKGVFEEIVASFAERLLGSFQVIVMDTPPPISPTTSFDNENNKTSEANISTNNSSNNNNNPSNRNSSNSNGKGKEKENRSFLVMTKTAGLTERSCFDEFKAALKFGEEMKALEQLAIGIESQFNVNINYKSNGIITHSNENIKSYVPSSSRLRAKMTEKLMAFVTAFHRAHVDEITNTVKADKWQEIPIPPGAIKLLSAVIVSSSSSSSAAASSSSSSTKNNIKMGNVFLIDDELYRTVSCGVRFVRSVCAYTLLTEQSPLPMLSVEIGRRGTELSRLFNNLVCKAILGVAALQWSGLRSITARHLSLASRTISLASRLCKDAHIILEKTLSTSNNSKTWMIIKPLMKSSEGDLIQHHEQLISKIVDVMLDRLTAHEQALKKLPWEKQMEMSRFEQPSKYVTTLVKETNVLHRILWHVLPVIETVSVFSRVWKRYANCLEDAYGGLDGVKDWISERVADDVTCVYQNFGRLDVSSQDGGLVFKPIADLYNRFAREVIEERGERLIRKERAKQRAIEKGQELARIKQENIEKENEVEKEREGEMEMEKEKTEKKMELLKRKEREEQREVDKKNDEEVSEMMNEMLGDEQNEDHRKQSLAGHTSQEEKVDVISITSTATHDENEMESKEESITGTEVEHEELNQVVTKESKTKTEADRSEANVDESRIKDKELEPEPETIQNGDVPDDDGQEQQIQEEPGPDTIQNRDVPDDDGEEEHIQEQEREPEPEIVQNSDVPADNGDGKQIQEEREPRPQTIQNSDVIDHGDDKPVISTADNIYQSDDNDDTDVFVDSVDTLLEDAQNVDNMKSSTPNTDMVGSSGIEASAESKQSN